MLQVANERSLWQDMETQEVSLTRMDEAKEAGNDLLLNHVRHFPVCRPGKENSLTLDPSRHIEHTLFIDETTQKAQNKSKQLAESLRSSLAKVRQRKAELLARLDNEQ
jgi:hypothetical protein